MILDTEDKSIGFSMGADPTTTQPTWQVDYVDIDMSTDPKVFQPISDQGIATGDSLVTIITPPGGGTLQRQVKYINIYNADSVQQTFNIFLIDDVTLYGLYKIALPAGKSVWWTPETGWTPGGVPGPQGDTGAQGDTGPPGMEWAGAWNSLTNYDEDDGVLYNGSAYICIADNTNETPSTEPSFWSLMAEKGTDGNDGAPGIDGTDGTNGVNAGFHYKFNTTTTPGNPGTGKVLINNASLSLATQFIINETDDLGNVLSAFINSWDDSTSTVKGILQVYDPVTPSNFFICQTGTLTDAGSYVTVNITVLSSGGSFTNNLGLMVSWVPAGNAGTNGTNGTNGQGVPTGGTTGQVLTKLSGTNYDTSWQTPGGGGGGGITKYASVYLSGSNITVPSATVTTMVYNTELYDVGSCYNTSNGRYTPGMDCLLQVQALVWMSTSTSTFFTVYEIYKNGTLLQAIAEPIPEAAAAALTVFAFNCSTTVLSNSTDYFELRFQQHSGGSKDMTQGQQKNWAVFTCLPI